MKGAIALIVSFIGSALSTSYEAPFGPEIAAAPPKSSVVTLTDRCEENAESYYEEYIARNYRFVMISGIPSHPAEYNQAQFDPYKRCERWQYARLPLTWADSGKISRRMGSDGFVMSGAVTFDDRGDDGDDAYTAMSQKGATLDPSNGHSNNQNQYHYHAVPTEFSNANDPAACEHIGYMLDGGKLYGRCQVDGLELQSCYFASIEDPQLESDYYYSFGKDGCQLDECNMYVYNGEASYFISTNFPWVPACMKGTVATIFGFTPDNRA